MTHDPANPLIVQSDRTILLETANPLFTAARDALSVFAELVKSPEHIHTYRVSALSLWNAAALGLTPMDVKDSLAQFSKFTLPPNLLVDIDDLMGRYGRLKLVVEEGEMVLRTEDPNLLFEISHRPQVAKFLCGDVIGGRVTVRSDDRGLLKHALIRAGFPVDDLAGYAEGAPLAIGLRPRTRSDKTFALREYQNEAVGAFWAGGGIRGGCGTVVLPCGAGKTVVGLGTMARIQTHTLILTTNTTALRQWRDEILDKTDLEEEMIGEYSGSRKEIRPVTLTTYQILTYRADKAKPFKHFGLFNAENWGLIIYDEVHLLPAPVFRAVANLQSRRRLGLTATLVREDGREDEVFSLIGPKKYDVPWRVLEEQGFIATAVCTEIRVPFHDDQLRLEYAVAQPRAKFRLAATNPAKDGVVHEVLSRHPGNQVLIIGQYLDQLQQLAEGLDAPIITGKTPQREREVLYERFRTKEIPRLVVSKVANFAVDLPDASVAIQVSGTFGSRQEEAQRLGRILRPKPTENRAHFYSVVTRDSTEQEYASRRQLFLTEQGYGYQIETFGDG
jgi:DNA excision repair protein ERCC-3